MRFRLCCFAFLLLVPLGSQAGGQIAGNSAYGGDNAQRRAEANERSLRVLSKEDVPPDHSMFVDASVLLNVKADEYVATFAVDREGPTIAEVAGRMDATVKQFTEALHALRVRDSDIYVDYVGEPKVYGYEVAENVAREKLTGFNLKKNVLVHYSDPALLDKLIAAAAGADIYDMVKVDYVIRNLPAINAQLMNEAAGVIQAKLQRDEKLLGVKVKSTPAIYAERTAVYYPRSLYDSYTAAESESVTRPANLSRLTVQNTRKTRTFYYNGLDGNGFDRVLNPVPVEPVVQCTLYLKLKYEIAQ